MQKRFWKRLRSSPPTCRRQLVQAHGPPARRSLSHTTRSNLQSGHLQNRLSSPCEAMMFGGPSGRQLLISRAQSMATLSMGGPGNPTRADRGPGAEPNSSETLPSTLPRARRQLPTIHGGPRRRTTKTTTTTTSTTTPQGRSCREPCHTAW